MDRVAVFVDAGYQWESSDLSDFLTRSPYTRAEPDSEELTLDPSGTGVAVDHLERVARDVAATVPEGEVATLIDNIRQTNTRPKQIDAPLLARSRNALGCDLDPAQKRVVRNAFLRRLEARLNEPSDEASQPPIVDS